MAWTQQQEAAINARDTSLIVSAAAGSGKTAVLTERLARLIADPESGVRADRMIVVTFTNDAASELKKRLDMKLRALISENPGDRHLLRQQILLQNARISTINSFCFELLRDNITDQGITSGFGVLDEADNKVLKAQAMDELYDYYTVNEYDKISRLYDLFCIKNEKRLTEVISRCDEFLASVALRNKWLDSAVGEYAKDFFSSAYHKALAASVQSALEKAKRLSEDCCSLIVQIFPDMSAPAAQKTLAQAELESENISKLIDIIASGRFPDSSEAESLSAFGDLVRTGKTAHNKALRDIYKLRRDRCKKLVQGAVESLSSYESDFRESREATVLLAEAVRRYEDIIWEHKCRKNAISFDDGERLALELLAEVEEDGSVRQSETAQRIAAYYDIIMIDEYQDSNNKEDMIFKLISRNYRTVPDGEPIYGDNVFLVGDVKQSIYGFRLANPKNFVRTLSLSEPYSPESGSRNQAIVLNRNFRSTEGVISFVNYVFGQLMTKRCGDIDYTDDEKLYPGAQEYGAIPAEECRTQITLIGCDQNDDEDGKTVSDDPEASWTAAKIAAMLAEGTSVAEKDGRTRPCRPSDFCILVRKNRFINVYADELAARGITARRSEESGYLRSREIAILIDLLRVISDPLLDIPLAAVLTSPMYMFTPGELGYIRSLDPERPLYPVLVQLAEDGFEECSDMFLIGRCREFLEALGKFRLDSVTMTTGELIRSIYDTTDFISVMQLGADGDKKRANLRALIQYAKGYEEAAAFEGTGGLSGFLRHIDRVMENGDYTQGKVSAAAGDYVAIQTLHGSKGLEYPFVFIAETSTEFKFDSDIAMFGGDGRVGYILCDKKLLRKYRTFQQITLTAEKECETRSEELRLLYVGLTRARQRLFINLKTGEKALDRLRSQVTNAVVGGSGTEDMILGAKRFSDWLWAVLMVHERFAEIAERLELMPEGAPLPAPGYSDDVFDIVYAGHEETVAETAEETVPEAQPDDAICAELTALIDHKYDTALSELPARLSVTQITKKFRGETESFDLKLRRPKFASGSSELTGAERGTAIHTFFQYCSFDNATKSPAEEIARIREMGYITAAEADSVSIPNVSAFFDSDLYARISRASRVWREKKFMVAVSQLDIENELMRKLKGSDGMIKGIIDLMFEEDGAVVIVDYKSDRGTSAEKLAERYRVQLDLYRSAIELTVKLPVKEAYLYSFELKKQIPVVL
ncbi:MAG: UvrD-helicase domain-containing protein [Ruminococcus sp.]|nr:UvrD-helicase domain-containing protein [Ruminococcus sp.]